MARKLNLVAPDIGTPDANNTEGTYLDEAVGVPGTPILADMKNQMYYFFSNLMAKSGLAFNDLVDDSLVSQFYDAFEIMAAVPRKQFVPSSQALVLGKYDWEVEVDLSLGNVAISALPVPDFIGQRVHIYGVGTGIGSIAGGTGLYVNGVFFTENTGGVFLTAVSLTEWRAENGVTADYVSGDYHVIKYANGNMELEYLSSSPSLASNASGNVFINAAAVTNAYPLSFTTILIIYGSSFNSVGLATWIGRLGATTTQLNYRIMASSVDASCLLAALIKGKY